MKLPPCNSHNLKDIYVYSIQDTKQMQIELNSITILIKDRLGTILTSMQPLSYPLDAFLSKYIEDPRLYIPPFNALI